MSSNKLTVSDFKKIITQKNKDELVQEILGLYKKIPQVKDFYALSFSDPLVVLNKYKEIIEKEFVYGATRGFPKARFNVARKCLNDFKKISSNQLLLAELTFHYAKCIADFNNEFGPDDEDFYTKSETLFEQSLELAKKNNALEHFKPQSDVLVEEASCGWGFKDGLSSTYNEYYGEFIK